MITKEKLLQCFQAEITEISEAQIASAKQEMQEIQKRMEKEISENAQDEAQRWYEQEADELHAQHAITMSHLNDENHYKLMQERTKLVESLFDEAKQQLEQFHQGKQYLSFLRSRLAAYEWGQEEVVLQLCQSDEALMPELLKQLPPNAAGEIVKDIALGGFRVLIKHQGKLIDETIDSALDEAHRQFLQTSDLTIS